MIHSFQLIYKCGRAFVLDYISRHRHPVNAVLHLVGVPMVFLGIYDLSTGSATRGLALFGLGYLLQYLGHKEQGNEVGEVILIKAILHKLVRKRNERAMGS